MKVEMFLIPSN